MPDEPPSLIEPGDRIEVPYHGWSFGHGTLRMRVNEVSPAFWFEGAVRQQVEGTRLRDDDHVVRQVATVKVSAVRKIPNQRPGT